MSIYYNQRYNSRKYLLVLVFLILPFNIIYSQNKYSDNQLYYQTPDSLNLKFSFYKKILTRQNFSLASSLSKLGLMNEKINFNSESYDDFYQNIYGISPQQKYEIDIKLIIALEKTFPQEDAAIVAMRKYLGISQELFAILLAIIHLAKYN
jgi:hypothetical protein